MITIPISSPPSMIPKESDVECISPLAPPAQSQSYRAMIHKLLERYTKEEIHWLIEEESSSISKRRVFVSKIHTLGQCPAHLFNPPSHLEPPEFAFFSSYAGHGSNNVSAAIPSSHHVNASAPSLLHAGNQQQIYAPSPSLSLPSAVPPQRTTVRNGSVDDTVFLTSAHGLGFTCGICAEECITLTCTRRYDLRRHIEKFHNSDAVWFCQHPGCRMAYDWPAAYQSHLRNAHRQSQMNMDEAVVKLCPQLVFACGFENCSHIFEAMSEDDTADTSKEYSRHIIKHFQEGPNCGRWTYSTRIRNLLRQSQVGSTWDKSCPVLELTRLQRDSQSSMALRKLLEARHLGNLPLLIEISIALGSNPAEASRFASKLELPVKTRCPYQHNPSLNAWRLSPQTHGEQESYQFNLSQGMSLDYPFSGVIQPAAHVPRLTQSLNYGLGKYNGPETTQSLNPHNYFIRDSSNYTSYTG